MSAWEVFASRQVHTRPPFLPHIDPSLPLPPINCVDIKPITSIPPPMSLNRYLQLLNRLCVPARDGTYTVKRLGDLDRAAVKVEDLKHILSLNGKSVVSKNKQDLLDKMVGMTLASPICIQPSKQDGHTLFTETIKSNPTRNVDALLQDAMSEAFKHVQMNPGVAATVNEALSTTGFYMCGYSHSEDEDEDEDDIEMDFAERDRSRCEAGSGLHHHLAPTHTKTDTLNYQWLLPQLHDLMQSCQASTDSSIDIVGRKVVLVFLENFAVGAEHIVPEGLCLGRVVELIGDVHDESNCPVNCSECHNFYYVRVRSMDGSMLDIEVDLREEYRRTDLNDLMVVGEETLADAWILVEPKY